MHELSLCENIVHIIERQAEQEGFTSVQKVALTVGDMAGVSTESLTFCFPLVAKDTVADGAELQFIPCEGNELKVSELKVV